MGGPKAADTKAAPPTGPDPKAADTKAAPPTAPDSKAADTKAVLPTVPDPKGTDTKAAPPTAPVPKASPSTDSSTEKDTLKREAPAENQSTDVAETESKKQKTTEASGN